MDSIKNKYIEGIKSGFVFMIAFLSLFFMLTMLAACDSGGDDGIKYYLIDEQSMTHVDMDEIRSWVVKSKNVSGPSYPRGIACDSKNNIYVGDGGYTIHKYDTEGNELATFGKFGFENGCFSGLLDIDVDKDDFLYVLDKDQCRVQKFDGEGNYILSFGSFGSSIGYFCDPERVFINSKNLIYVSDTGNNCIKIYSSTGAYVSCLECEDFFKPTGISEDDEGNMFFIGLNPLMMEISSDLHRSYYRGNFGNTYPIYMAYASSIDKDNRYAVIIIQNNEYYQDGKLLIYDFNNNVYSEREAGLMAGVCFDSEGYVYVSNQSDSSIHKFQVKTK